MGLGDECGGADEAVEAGAFLEGDGAVAENLTADMALDARGVRGDGMEEFDAGAFFDTQVAAAEGGVDFAAAADDEVAGAIDICGERAKHGEVVAA